MLLFSISLQLLDSPLSDGRTSELTAHHISLAVSWLHFCQPVQQFQLPNAAKSQGSAGPLAVTQSPGTPRKNALKHVDRGRIFLLKIHFTSFSVVEVVFFPSFIFFFF